MDPRVVSAVIEQVNLWSLNFQGKLADDDFEDQALASLEDLPQDISVEEMVLYLGSFVVSLYEEVATLRNTTLEEITKEKSLTMLAAACSPVDGN